MPDAAPKPVTVPDVLAAKGARKLAVVTAYDYTSAALAAAAVAGADHGNGGPAFFEMYVERVLGGIRR